MAESQFGTNSHRERKRVLYEGVDIIREGMPVAYNYNTADNILGLDTGVIPNVKKGTTTEGGQNEGKFQRVELCTADNAEFFAGVVAGTSFAGLTGTGAMWIDIFVANGSIVPVRTDKNIAAKDAMYLEAASQEAINDDDALPRIGTAVETIDRSVVTGLVLCKVNSVSLGATIQTTNSLASVADAPALALGDLMVPVDVAGVTWYLPLMADSGQ